MIGWRPIVVTLFAGVVIAVAVVHSAGSAPCANADSLRSANLLSEARDAYVDLLRKDSPPGCAGSGLDRVTRLQCKQAGKLKAASTEDAKKAYLEIATAEPVRDDAECAWTALQVMATE